MERELPDLAICDTAEQFYLTAEFLLKNAPAVGAPSALVCNAALAIELFLKSLDSKWKLHACESEGHQITSHANCKDHLLERLFARLEPSIQHEFRAAFQLCDLARAFSSLDEVLTAYSGAFVEHRYVYERNNNPPARPINEIVKLAAFIRSHVRNMPVVRYLETRQSN